MINVSISAIVIIDCHFDNAVNCIDLCKKALVISCVRSYTSVSFDVPKTTGRTFNYPNMT